MGETSLAQTEQPQYFEDNRSERGRGALHEFRQLPIILCFACRATLLFLESASFHQLRTRVLEKNMYTAQLSFSNHTENRA